MNKLILISTLALILVVSQTDGINIFRHVIDIIRKVGDQRINPLTPELQEMVGNERLLKIFNSYHPDMTKWLNLVSAYLGFSR